MAEGPGVAYSEGCTGDPRVVTPSALARSFAARWGKAARQIEAMLRESAQCMDHVEICVSSPYGAWRQRDRFDVPFKEGDIGGAGLLLVLLGQGHHLVGHVQAVGEAGRPNAPGTEQDVDPTARAKIEHGIALMQVNQRGGIAAAE